MNSSGILKKGLAASAISALAVTGIPALATSATAAVGDAFTVVSSGPALNGGTEGAVVVIREESGTIDPTLIEAVGTSGNTVGTEDNGDQNVEVVSASSLGADPADPTKELIEVRVAVTTTTTGGTATFRLFEDDGATVGTLEASEARAQASVSTAGPLADIVIAPATQSTPQGITSGAYTVTLKDAAGRTTQLAPATSVTVADEVPVEANGIAADDTITSDEIADGVESFRVDPNGATVGAYDITLTQGAVTETAVLNVTASATITAADLNIVTAADTWNGFGNPNDSDGDSTTTFVRVDQNTIRFDFDADDTQAGANVQLMVDGTDALPNDPTDGNGVTFGGQNTATYTTTLDANGNGSITVTADAATVQDGDQFATDINGFDQTIVFQRAVAKTIDGESATYFCQDDSTCTVTAVVTDQFGNPVTTGEVEASRTGQNNDATPQRKPVGPDGTVDFTFTDTNPVDGGTDTVLFEYFLDQFDNTAEFGDNSTVIKYSATGQGNDYVISLDTQNTEAGTYTPSDAAVIPLADGNDTTPDEDSVISIAGGEPNQEVTLSVDNGGLILAPGKTSLADGTSSVTTTLDGSGNLTTDYRVIGTTSGLVTLTVDSAGRTETAQLTVSAQTDVDTARNITLSGPATVPAGTNQITFTAVVTDEFGNPVAGFDNNAFSINKIVTGPGQYQDGDATSDANGQIKLNVRVDANASGDVTLSIDVADGFGQFGAQADREHSYSLSDDALGLTASSDKASATTTVEGATPPTPKSDTVATLVENKKTGGKIDKLKVTTESDNVANEARVNLFRINKNGQRVLVESSQLNFKGIKRFQVADTNGKKVTKYVARVRATDDTKGDKRTNRESAR